MNPMTACRARGEELGAGQGKEQIMDHLGCKKQICFQLLECGKVALVEMLLGTVGFKVLQISPRIIFIHIEVVFLSHSQTQEEDDNLSQIFVHFKFYFDGKCMTQYYWC